MRAIDDLFRRLSASRFRSRFRLGPAERAYIEKKGLPVILKHAEDFIAARLAPAHPVNDGKQTPMRGNPVFVAQHATATCCRGCLQKWHHIASGRELSEAERRHVLAVIKRWLLEQAVGDLSSSNNAD